MAGRGSEASFATNLGTRPWRGVKARGPRFDATYVCSYRRHSTATLGTFDTAEEALKAVQERHRGLVEAEVKALYDSGGALFQLCPGSFPHVFPDAAFGTGHFVTKVGQNRTTRTRWTAIEAAVARALSSLPPAAGAGNTLALPLPAKGGDASFSTQEPPTPGSPLGASSIAPALSNTVLAAPAVDPYQTSPGTPPSAVARDAPRHVRITPPSKRAAPTMAGSQHARSVKRARLEERLEALAQEATPAKSDRTPPATSCPAPGAVLVSQLPCAMARPLTKTEVTHAPAVLARRLLAASPNSQDAQKRTAFHVARRSAGYPNPGEVLRFLATLPDDDDMLGAAAECLSNIVRRVWAAWHQPGGRFAAVVQDLTPEQVDATGGWELFTECTNDPSGRWCDG